MCGDLGVRMCMCVLRVSECFMLFYSVLVPYSYKFPVALPPRACTGAPHSPPQTDRGDCAAVHATAGKGQQQQPRRRQKRLLLLRRLVVMLGSPAGLNKGSWQCFFFKSLLELLAPRARDAAGRLEDGARLGLLLFHQSKNGTKRRR